MSDETAAQRPPSDWGETVRVDDLLAQPFLDCLADELRLDLDPEAVARALNDALEQAGL